MPSDPSSTKTATAKKPAKPKRAKAPTQDDIQRRAYEISESTGNGDPVGNWLEAERELVAGAKPKPRRRKPAP
jgi:hypothetical protein